MRSNEEANMIRKMTIGLLLGFCISFFGCRTDINHIKAEIIEVTEKMAKLWNEGNLEEYMSYYEKSDSITFQSNTARVYGWYTIQSLFVNMFKDENIRGKLSFSEIEMKAISADYVFSIGKFHIVYPNSQTREGYYTVLYKKFPDGWKIIHDHS